VTGSSVRPSSGFDTRTRLARGEIKLWFRPVGGAADSETFLRTVLSRYTGLAPSALAIERGEHGKPFLANVAHAVHFSLSHSGNWMVCAVAGESALGVDLEVHDSRRDVLALAQRFYSAAECRELMALEGACRVRHFYDLWTLREARVKALGSTLARELEGVGFRVDGSGAVSCITAQPDIHHGFYGLYSVLPGYSLALCTRSSGPPGPRVSSFDLPPAGEAQEIPCRLLTSSRP
jgi:4'-phosphopantetheinyl transferase